MELTKVSSLIAQTLQVDVSEIEIIEKTAGMSNHTFIFKHNGEKFTFRIPGNGDEMFVKRKCELDILKAIDDESYTTTTILSDYDNGYKVSKFLDGVDLAKLPFEEVNYDEVANLLKQIHNTEIICEQYNPLERIKWYESHNGELSETFYHLKNLWLEQYNLLKTDKLVFCHNDSQMSNIIATSEGYKIIDFEFAAMNELEYDLAAFGNNDFTMAIKLGKAYFKDDFTNLIAKRIYMWRIFQCLQWHNVATTKANIGLGDELGIDFSFVANKYLNLAEQLLNELNTIEE